LRTSGGGALRAGLAEIVRLPHVVEELVRDDPGVVLDGLDQLRSFSSDYIEQQCAEKNANENPSDDFDHLTSPSCRAEEP